MARFLARYGRAPEAAGQTTLYALLSDRRGYLVMMPESRQPSILRTFLVGSAQERTALLARETLVTTALADSGQTVGQLQVCDADGGIVIDSLQGGTGLKAGVCDPAALAGPSAGEGRDGLNPVDFALACGAALAPAEKDDTVSLRNDHLPYLGRKRKVQNAVRLLSISMTMLLLALGVYVHSNLIRVNQQRQAVRDKLEEDYLQVMPGEKKLPVLMGQAVEKLRYALSRVKQEKKGEGGDQDSVSAKLTQILRGLNACARQVDLNIDSITITASSTIITGDTSSRQNTANIMKEALQKEGLAFGPITARPEGQRDAFTITLMPTSKKAEGK